MRSAFLIIALLGLSPIFVLAEGNVPGGCLCSTQNPYAAGYSYVERPEQTGFKTITITGQIGYSSTDGSGLAGSSTYSDGGISFSVSSLGSPDLTVTAFVNNPQATAVAYTESTYATRNRWKKWEWGWVNPAGDFTAGPPGDAPGCYAQGLVYFDCLSRENATATSGIASSSCHGWGAVVHAAPAGQNGTYSANFEKNAGVRGAASIGGTSGATYAIGVNVTDKGGGFSAGGGWTTGSSLSPSTGEQSPNSGSQATVLCINTGGLALYMQVTETASAMSQATGNFLQTGMFFGGVNGIANATTVSKAASSNYVLTSGPTMK